MQCNRIELDQYSFQAGLLIRMHRIKSEMDQDCCSLDRILYTFA